MEQKEQGGGETVLMFRVDQMIILAEFSSLNQQH